MSSPTTSPRSRSTRRRATSGRGSADGTTAALPARTSTRGGCRGEAGLELPAACRRRELAVPGCALPQLAVDHERLERALEQLGEPRDAFAWRGQLEQLLLARVAELDAGRDLELEQRRAGVGRLARRAHRLLEALEGLVRAVEIGRVRRVVLVDDLLDGAGVERALVVDLEQTEAIAALDNDVHAPVRQHLQHLDDRGSRPDVVHVAARLGEDDAELLLTLETLADELLVARLEDVQRHPLGRHQHELEREEPDHGHASRLRL